MFSFKMLKGRSTSTNASSEMNVDPVMQAKQDELMMQVRDGVKRTMVFHAHNRTS